MKLSKLIKSISPDTSVSEIEIDSIVENPKNATCGSIFVCIIGARFNGHSFAPDAYRNGCRVFVASEKLTLPDDATVISVLDTRVALAHLASVFYGMPSKELSDTPHLSRVLMRLFSRPAEVKAEERKPKSVWLPDLQVRIVEGWQPMMGHVWRMVTAMKGGHNAESHNHNDVGSFLVGTAFDDGPLQMEVVDAGNMVYTAKTFSDRRYELWNCRAAYHNVPIIGGVEQHEGSQYAAKNVEGLGGGIALDMTDAYPAEAGVQQYRRAITQGGSALRVRDEIVCQEPKAVTWVFMLRREPIIEHDQQLCHTQDGTFTVSWQKHGGLTAAVEPIDITDARMAKSYPGKLWRLTLTAEPALQHVQEFCFES